MPFSTVTSTSFSGSIPGSSARMTYRSFSSWSSMRIGWNAPRHICVKDGQPASNQSNHSVSWRLGWRLAMSFMMSSLSSISNDIPACKWDLTGFGASATTVIRLETIVPLRPPELQGLIVQASSETWHVDFGAPDSSRGSPPCCETGDVPALGRCLKGAVVVLLSYVVHGISSRDAVKSLFCRFLLHKPPPPATHRHA